MGLEWLVVSEYVIHFTSCKLAGIVGGTNVNSSGKCVCGVVREIKCFLYEVYILCALGLFLIEFSACMQIFKSVSLQFFILS